MTDIFTTDKKYGIIYADPPWSYKDKNCDGAAAQQYSIMSDADIGNLPIGKLADKDCVLFMWATYPKLAEALKTIEAWGFTYKTIGFQWVKQNKSGNGFFFGLGRWTRGNTECCLIAVKGKPHRVSNAVSQLVFSPLRAHSQKPDEIRNKIIELVGDLPRIELFARTAPAGWDYWGDQTDKFTEELSDMIDYEKITCTHGGKNVTVMDVDADGVSFEIAKADCVLNSLPVKEVTLDVC